MEGFRIDVKLIITKTFLRVGFFVLIAIGMQRWLGNRLGDTIENQEIVAMTQSVQEDQETREQKIFDIYTTTLYKTTIDILLYNTCTICQQKQNNNNHDNTFLPSS